MIVTRQRKQKKSSLPILLPIAAIAMLVVALTWPPSRNFITNGPLKPVATVFDTVWGTVSRPLTFAYQQQQITDRNEQIKELNDKLEVDRKAAADQDAQVQQLQKQIADLNNQPEATPAAVAALPAQGTAAAPGGAPAADAAAPVSNSVRLAAQQWAAMDPGKAAALVQKLPAIYVSSVFAQMSPDAVGPIMDALPPKVAALIIQSGTTPQISAQAGR
jgi:hypothetical protein